MELFLTALAALNLISAVIILAFAGLETDMFAKIVLQLRSYLRVKKRTRLLAMRDLLHPSSLQLKWWP